jgi:hypothetical protein
MTNDWKGLSSSEASGEHVIHKLWQNRHVRQPVGSGLLLSL